MVNLKSSRWPKYTQLGTIFQKKIMFYYRTFFSSSNMFFIRLFLGNTWKKNRGSPCSFTRKGEFILLSSLVWGKSLTFCTCTRSCARTHVHALMCTRSCARAHVHALMTRKSCAVGMCNAIPRNYLKEFLFYFVRKLIELKTKVCAFYFIFWIVSYENCTFIVITNI